MRRKVDDKKVALFVSMQPAWASATQIVVFDDALFKDFAGSENPLLS